MADLSNKSDRLPKKIGPMGIWYFTDRSLKYTLAPLRNSRTTEAFDLEFSPVIGLDNLDLQNFSSATCVVCILQTDQYFT